jgi:hypothetical protein
MIDHLRPYPLNISIKQQPSTIPTRVFTPSMIAFVKLKFVAKFIITITGGQIIDITNNIEPIP